MLLYMGGCYITGKEMFLFFTFLLDYFSCCEISLELDESYAVSTTKNVSG